MTTKIKDFKGGITRFWWIPLIIGLAGIGMGIWCLCSPSTSIPVLALVFAIFMCIIGLLNIIFGIVNSGIMPNWGWNIAIGVIEVVFGIWLMTLPSMTISGIFIYAIGFYMIVEAVGYMIEECSWLSYSKNWVAVLLFVLLCSLLLSCIFLSGPIFGEVIIWLYIGFALIFMGIYRLAFAARLRKSICDSNSRAVSHTLEGG